MGGHCTVSAEESDESREECPTCNGDGKYRKPKAEPEKPKCIECSKTLRELPDGESPRYCSYCRAEQSPPPRTKCSKADCAKDLQMKADGTPPKFCGECGTVTCDKCWGFCASRRVIQRPNVDALLKTTSNLSQHSV